MSPARLRFAFDTPRAALRALLAELSPVEAEHVPWREATGRILAEPLGADRDSPGCDVSAMDGYAVRLEDVAAGELPVVAEAWIGRAPPELPPGAAVRIVTGAPVPAQAGAVIPREELEESRASIRLPRGLRVRPGQHIRRRGENVREGEQVIPAGRLVDPAGLGALATFGVAKVPVHRRVRVAIVTTGDELRDVEASLAPWELRDSNGPALLSMLALRPWAEVVSVERARDSLADIRSALERALSGSDAVLATGGVSMGDRDHVPQAVREAGGRVVFHKLPLRPGKPVLGAVGPQGQAIFGLPGNPVSVLVTARRLALPALAHRAGVGEPDPAATTVVLGGADGRRLGLWWYRPVHLEAGGRARLVPGRGSGDVVSAARADGFVEIPPDAAPEGAHLFYPWR